MRNTFFRRRRGKKPGTSSGETTESDDQDYGDDEKFRDTFGFSEFKFDFGIALRIDTLHPNFQKRMDLFRAENPESKISDAEITHQMAYCFILNRLGGVHAKDFENVGFEMIIGAPGLETPQGPWDGEDHSSEEFPPQADQ